jgi:hypothetical protein
MNYLEIYNKLVRKAQARSVDSYTERHHIIPRCIGGTDDKENIVRFTPEEHFLAHQLLVKIYPNEPKLVLAVRYMCYDSNGKRINNKMFGWLKRLHSQSISQINKGRYVSPELAKRRGEAQRGRVSPMKGKTHSEESKNKTSEALRGRKKPPRTKEHRENHANSIRGVPVSAETKNKISLSTKGKSYEERYGKEEADRRKEIYRLAWIKRKLNKISQESLQLEY